MVVEGIAIDVLRGCRGAEAQRRAVADSPALSLRLTGGFVCVLAGVSPQGKLSPELDSASGQ